MIEEVKKIDYVFCSRCGKRVSNKTGVEMTVRAWVECPECIRKDEPKPDDEMKTKIAKSNAVGMGLIPPDEGRLYTSAHTIDELMADYGSEVMAMVQEGNLDKLPKLREQATVELERYIKAQRDLTASIKDAECQEKIDQIVKDDADRCAGYLKMAREECQARVERIRMELIGINGMLTFDDVSKALTTLLYTLKKEEK